MVTNWLRFGLLSCYVMLLSDPLRAWAQTLEDAKDAHGVPVKEGDVCRVCNPRVKLQMKQTVLHRFQKGDEVTVQKVDRGWLRPSIRVDGKALEGWLEAKNVAKAVPLNGKEQASVGALDLAVLNTLNVLFGQQSPVSEAVETALPQSAGVAAKNSVYANEVAGVLKHLRSEIERALSEQSGQPAQRKAEAKEVAKILAECADSLRAQAELGALDIPEFIKQLEAANKKYSDEVKDRVTHSFAFGFAAMAGVPIPPPDLTPLDDEATRVEKATLARAKLIDGIRKKYLLKTDELRSVATTLWLERTKHLKQSTHRPGGFIVESQLFVTTKRFQEAHLESLSITNNHSGRLTNCLLKIELDDKAGSNVVVYQYVNRWDPGHRITAVLGSGGKYDGTIYGATSPAGWTSSVKLLATADQFSDVLESQVNTTSDILTSTDAYLSRLKPELLSIKKHSALRNSGYRVQITFDKSLPFKQVQILCSAYAKPVEAAEQAIGKEAKWIALNEFKPEKGGSFIAGKVYDTIAWFSEDQKANEQQPQALVVTVLVKWNIGGETVTIATKSYSFERQGNWP